MKIGVIGPVSTSTVIQKVTEDEIPDIQLILHCYAYYEQSPAIADDFQRQGSVDAILFTGPTLYQYTARRVTPTVPWACLPHNRISLLQAMVEANIHFQSDLRAISIDRCSQELVREVLQSVGVADPTILRAPYDEEELDLERKLLDFHRDCYRRGKVSLCITNMEHICQPLLDEGIPCVRVVPAKEVVLEQIAQLYTRTISALENQGRLAVVAIHYDYVFDDERNLFTREWDKMVYQNQFKEQVYTVAQRLQAAVFGDTYTMFFLVTTRMLLEKIFLDEREYSKLLRFGQRSDRCRVWLGIGVGDTMLQAYSLAAMALNQARSKQSGTTYLVDSESESSRQLDTWRDTAAVYTVKEFSQQVGLSPYSLKKIAAALRGADTIVASQLAQLLGITTRSANRIIARLEEKGCATIVGKAGEGRGRPTRIVRIDLPSSVVSELDQLP